MLSRCFRGCLLLPGRLFALAELGDSATEGTLLCAFTCTTCISFLLCTACISLLSGRRPSPLPPTWPISPKIDRVDLVAVRLSGLTCVEVLGVPHLPRPAPSHCRSRQKHGDIGCGLQRRFLTRVPAFSAWDGLTMTSGDGIHLIAASSPSILEHRI
jgi:hypothetical protein